MLRELDVRPPLDVRELCGRLARQRGRPIRLVAHPIKVPGPFGLWFETESMDVIFYQRETTRPHQDHIILHEIGHLVADHPSDEDDGEDPDGLTPDGTTRALRRTCYDSAYEREAELIATVILEWASVLNPLYPSARRAGDAHVERLDASLSHHQGWL
jgi:Zn-dependent peptidase ImmA (M78 family)